MCGSLPVVCYFSSVACCLMCVVCCDVCRLLLFDCWLFAVC